MPLTVDGREFAALRDVHDWARRALPSEVVVQAEGVITGAGTSWTHPVPLTVRGGTWDGSGTTGRSPGWWLSWRTPATLTLRGVTVCGFARGGVDAGCDVGRSAVVSAGCSYVDLGGHDPDGYAALFGTRSDITSSGDTFRRLVNPGEAGPLIHAVYASDHSVARIEGASVYRCSGDPFRVRHASRMEVVGCTAKRSGVQSMCSDWYAPDEQPSLLSTRDCHAGRTFNGSRPSLIAYRLRRTP